MKLVITVKQKDSYGIIYTSSIPTNKFSSKEDFIKEFDKEMNAEYSVKSLTIHFKGLNFYKDEAVSIQTLDEWFEKNLG